MSRHRLLSLLLLLGVAVAGLTVGATRLRAATPAITLVLPAAEIPPIGDTIDVLINITDAANLGAWQFDLSYDPTLVTVTGMTINPAFAAEDDCNAQTQRCAVVLGPIVDNPARPPSAW
ncbi:MAG: cohesin domain-containing protein [Caldilineaceae bacterium]